MRRSLISFLVSFVGILVLLLVASVAFAIYADANAWPGTDISVGPLTFVQTTNTPSESSFTMGLGVPVAAFVLALINAGVAAALGSRSPTARTAS